MRKIFYVLTLIVFSITSGAYAQIEAGSLFIGGNLGVSSGSSKSLNGSVTVDGPKTTSISVVPTVGYFLGSKLSVGAGVGLEYDKIKSTVAGVDSEATASLIIFRPNAKYFHSFTDNFYGFVEAGIGLGSGSSKSSAGGVTADGPKISNISVYIAPGLTLFPTEKIGVDFRLNLINYYRNKSTDPTDSSIKDISSGVNFGLNTLSPSVGIYYFL
ncbi:MAG: outer membrane beta-barrel protein [Cyclobacteriaceae bacterium]|nr:outer membrane beta-barrel protein [Cyclobacteriaceae bacterium]